MSIEEDLSIHSPSLENEESLSVAPPIDELDLNPSDLEQIALIYDQIRALFRTKQTKQGKVSSVDKKLASEFDGHLKTVMLNLSNALRSAELTVKEKNAEVLKSKYFLYDVCFEKAIQYMTQQEYQSLQENGPPSNRTSQESAVFDQIRQGTCACFVYMSQQIAAPEQLQLDNRRLIRENGRLTAALAEKDKEMGGLVERNHALEQALQQFKELQDSMERDFEAQKEQMSRQIENVQAESQRCIDKLLKSQKEASALRDSLTSEQRRTADLQSQITSLSQELGKKGEVSNSCETCCALIKSVEFKERSPFHSSEPSATVKGVSKKDMMVSPSPSVPKSPLGMN